MSRPTPSLVTVVGALARIETVAPGLAESARWLWPIGYQRPTTSEKVGGRPSGINRPTEAILAGAPQQRVRDNINTAGLAVMVAAAQLEGALSALARAAKAIDDPDKGTPVAEFHDPAPRLISRAELERAQKAQARRSARGQGWGEG